MSRKKTLRYSKAERIVSTLLLSALLCCGCSRTTSESSADALTELMNHGERAYRAGDYGAAISAYEDAVKRIESANKPGLIYVRALNKLADAEIAFGRKDRVSGLFDRALRAIKGLEAENASFKSSEEWLREKHRALAGFAEVHNDLGQFKIAETTYRQALDIEERLNIKPSDAESCTFRYSQMVGREKSEAEIMDQATADRLERQMIARGGASMEAHKEFRDRFVSYFNQHRGSYNQKIASGFHSLLKEAESKFGYRASEYRLALQAVTGYHADNKQTSDAVKLLREDMLRYRHITPAILKEGAINTIEDARFLAEDYLLLSVNLRLIDRYGEALAAARRAVEFAEILFEEGSKELVQPYIEMAECQRLLRDKEAWRFREKAYRIMLHHSSTRRIGFDDFRIQLAQEYAVSGQYQKSIEMFEAVRPKLEGDPSRSKALQTLLISEAVCYYRLADWSESMRCFKHATAVGEKNGSMVPLDADVWSLLAAGSRCNDMSGLEFCVSARERSYLRKPKKQFLIELAELNCGFGDYLGSLNQHARAINAYKKAGDYISKAGQTKTIQMVGLLNRMGNLYLSMLRLNDAEASYQKSLSVLESVDHPSKDQQTSTLIQASTVLMRNGKLDQAQKLVERARDIALSDTTGNSRPYLAFAYLKLIELANHAGNREKARSEFVRACEVVKTIDWDFMNIRSVYAEMGSHAKQMGDLDSAALWYRKVLDGYEQHNNTIDAFRVQILTDYMELLTRQKKVAEAEKVRKERDEFARKLKMT